MPKLLPLEPFGPKMTYKSHEAWSFRSLWEKNSGQDSRMGTLALCMKPGEDLLLNSMGGRGALRVGVARPKKQLAHREVVVE